MRLLPCLALCLVACSADGDDAPPGDASPDGPKPVEEEADQCGASVEAGAGDAWTAMALVDDNSNPDHPIRHAGADFVTGIYYATPDQGVLVSADDGRLNPEGGAVFAATASTVTKVLFSGGESSTPRHMGTIDFSGVERTATGYVAMAYASELVVSSDNGATFAKIDNSAQSRFSIERVLALAVTDTGTTMVRDNGTVSVSSTAPSASASYDDVWGNNLGNSMCAVGPKSSTSPVTRSSVYVSPKRSRIAYTTNAGGVTAVCHSVNGGLEFKAEPLTVPTTAQPTGVMFPTRKIGIAWYGNPIQPGWIRRTADGGASWGTVALPAAVASHNMELFGGHFATDCMHAWIVGYDHTDLQAIMLASSDAGASWSVVAGVGAAVDAAHGDKLYSVFALDTAHIWAGGASGVVIHN